MNDTDFLRYLEEEYGCYMTSADSCRLLNYADEVDLLEKLLDKSIASQLKEVLAFNEAQKNAPGT